MCGRRRHRGLRQGCDAVKTAGWPRETQEVCLSDQHIGCVEVDRKGPANLAPESHSQRSVVHTQPGRLCQGKNSKSRTRSDNQTASTGKVHCPPRRSANLGPRSPRSSVLSDLESRPSRPGPEPDSVSDPATDHDPGPETDPKNQPKLNLPTN